MKPFQEMRQKTGQHHVFPPRVAACTIGCIEQQTTISTVTQTFSPLGLVRRINPVVPLLAVVRYHEGLGSGLTLLPAIASLPAIGRGTMPPHLIQAVLGKREPAGFLIF